MEEKITPEPIMKIMWGKWSSRALHTAVDLEIFTKISEGANTIEKVSNELNIEKRPAEILLNACTALNLLTKEGEEYKNTQEAEKFLVKGKPSYYGDMVLMLGSGFENWENLKQVILTNSPSSEKGLAKRMEDPKQAEIFTKAMHNNAVGPAMLLSKKFDFSRFKKLLDLGGGSGAFSIILTKEYTNLEATVFELPNVCKVAERYIQEAKAERVKTFSGNFLKDEFPENHDIVLLSQIIHSWGAEENKTLLKKVYESLPKEGVIIINEFLLNKDKTGPLFPALFALNMLNGSENGNAYTAEEIKSWLEETGFQYLETIKLTGPISSIISKK
jgi:ubiquinone/menaquinone biosynthesis C-methylase UbiE